MKFIAHSYYSGYEMEPEELYGMGRECVNVSGPWVEYEVGLMQMIKELSHNSSIPNHHIKNFKYEIKDFSDAEITQLKIDERMKQVCEGYSPCGLYGCKNPEHELHWIII